MSLPAFDSSSKIRLEIGLNSRSRIADHEGGEDSRYPAPLARGMFLE